MYIAVSICSLIAAYCLSSCTPPISKSIQRVLTNKDAFDTVGETYLLLHPCNNETISSKTDTLIQHDSSVSYEPYYVDCPDAYDTTKVKVVKVTIPVKTYITNTKIVDSITKIDGQQISILKSQIENKQLNIAVLSTNLSDLQMTSAATIKQLQHKLDIADWEFWGLVAAIVLYLAVRVVLWIKKPAML